MTTIDLSSISHHQAMEEIVDTLCTKVQNTDRSFFQAEVAYYLGKMAATMRVVINTKDRGEIPVNIYSLALAPSGYGKGHSINIMEEQFLDRFKERFVEDTFPVLAEQNLWVVANRRAGRKGTDQQEEFEKTQKEFDRFGPYLFTFDSGTVAGTKDMRQKLLLGGAGAINYQVDEIGSNLSGSTELLTLFLELYDQGKVKQKLTKNSADNPRSQEIDGKTPANMLLFGTPSKVFDGGQTEEQFYSFLETGYARRCIFGYGQKASSITTLSGKEIFNQLTKPDNEATVQKWANHFYTLADPALFGWKMDLPDDVAIALIDYRVECEKRANQLAEHEEIQKAEISHRYFKALKLAGVYAFIDQSTEVEMDHLMSAIKLVEESGEAFISTLTRDKAYVKVAKFIAQVGTEVTHADLHEAMPFYKSGQQARNEMMTLATAWGYKNHIIIKKTFVDNIEFFKGETLKETNLDQMVISYSDHWAYNYLPEQVPFDKLHILTQAQGKHWANHHFKLDHRSEENVIEGFNTVVFDIDGGISLSSVHELMKDYYYLTYTTKRHTDEVNRFRLILPINYQLELNQDEYKEFMNGLMAWLPFQTDTSANQRAKKWESFDKGSFHYNLDGSVLDVLDFIPQTSRNETYRQQNQNLDSLDNLERWFAGRISSGNRNNQMIKYALCLVDAGWQLPDVRTQVHTFNKKLSEPMTETEVDSTILVTAAKRYQKS